MAEINVASQLSFGEIAKRTGADGSVLEIFEAMQEVNPVFKFIPAIPCSHGFQHRVTRRTSLPSGTWRKAYKGVAKKASTTQVARFECAQLCARSEIDEDIIDMSDDPKALRRSEDIAFVEGMQQQVMDELIYGESAGQPESIDGLINWLDDLSYATVVDGGNAGGTSIWVIDFSPKTTCMIYPKWAKGGPMGLSINTDPSNNGGKEKVFDADNLPYYAYVTVFKWWLGVAIRDQMAIGRYCNLNNTVGGSSGFNENKLIEMLNYGRFNPRSTYMLMTKEMKAQMQIRAKDKANVNWNIVNALSGEEVAMFGGYAPCMRCDSVLTNESTVT